MRIHNICNKVIEYSFYALFFLVPLAFASDTFELFEFNKMWVTFVLTIIIGASWITKIIVQKKIYIQKTPLDIPIALFLISQVISTIISWDTHISIWGYYSRFNGGLLSIISYVFLYYAFVSNLAVVSMVKRLLLISLFSGLAVALWGLPSHFGYDLTCLLFRGSLDTNCWTADFQPKVRIFSTLGQPSWLAAYLAILLPISIIMFIKHIKNLPLSIFYLLLSALFYLALLYTSAKSGFLAVWISLAFFFACYIWLQRKEIAKHLPKPKKLLLGYWYLLVLFVVLVLITFIAGQPFSQLENFTLDGIKKNITNTQSKQKSQSQSPPLQRFAGELGGTDSGKIRKIVWQGAVDIWRSNPIFGTGVETFAFAYYRFRPEAHNLTSEWNFLYNKAHNEFLNYLATTGVFGLGTYLLMISWFLFRGLPFVMLNSFQHPNQTGSRNKFGMTEDSFLILALIAGYFSILVTNFFGFSVVITNIYLFLIPAFVFVLTSALRSEDKQQPASYHITPWQWTFIALVIVIALYMLATLIRYWNADKAYALGSNLNKAGEYQQAYPMLLAAVEKRAGEPVFKDELAVNNAILAASLITQLESQTSTDTASLANQLAQDAITLSNSITSQSPNNILFWKSRVRIFYALSQASSEYLPQALEAVKTAHKLAPTDANISYNLGVLYGQNNEVENGIKTLENTIKLKPDYRDAYYALGLFYHDQAVDDRGSVVDKDKLNKAIEQLQFILDNLGEDKFIKETLEQWKKL